MPTLALMSGDPRLYHELVSALSGATWSVARYFEEEATPSGGAPLDIVVVDGSDPRVEARRTRGRRPVLLIVEDAAPRGWDRLADDIVFRPLRREELLIRLERLQSGTPTEPSRSDQARSNPGQTERELRKTMEFLQSLIDASFDAIVAANMQGRVVLFNPTAARISGRDATRSLSGLTLEDLFGRAAAELVVRRLSTPEHGGVGRLEPTLLDLIDVCGERVPVLLSASLIYEDETPSAIVLIFADQRDRLRVEQRLADAQKKLAFTEKRGVLAELAGTAAHELNQPLTSMMACAELLERQSEPESSAAKAAAVLIREAERMADIVRKIGRITRYETTAYVGHQKIFDLDRAVDATREPEPKG